MGRITSRPSSAHRRRGLTERKVFFFEKKNQKTFTRSLTRRISISTKYANAQEFFASIFQK
jgi:hypothetical protein